jgi:hypothetical protein
MIASASFRRKVIYGCLIAALLFPLYLLSRPSVRESDGRLTKGGLLAQLRSEHELSQADLGEIDPASESMKLATLGMRGIAANLLWERANRYKREHDWDNLTATLNQISKLQPNFISVWQFQGWNLAYNVSVEFDDYRSRYHWVKRGINFLRDGVRHNSQEPVLYWELGWTFGHKIGKADEYVQYRRLFREDEDFHQELSANIDMERTLGPDNRPDNWLAGREWFLRGQQVVDSGIPIRGRLVDDSGRVRRGKTPLIFHSHPARWLIAYATAIEEEGYLDEKAQIAWRRAANAWSEFGQREIPTSYGFVIRLEDYDRMKREADKYGQQLDELLPGVREEIEREKRALLTSEEQAAMAIAPEERNDEQRILAELAERKARARYPEMAERTPAELKNRVDRLVAQGELAQAFVDAIFNYRDQVNYDYWKLRCDVEQQDDAIAARRFVFEADQAYEQSADLETMRVKYEAAWDKWATIFEKYPAMMEDTTAEDLMVSLRRYAWLLSQLDEPFPPPDFKLQPLLEVQGPVEEVEE